MQRFGGLLLILTGVSLGAYTFLPPPFDGEQSLREMTRISAAPDRSLDGIGIGPGEGAGSLYAGQRLAAASNAGNRLETGAVNKPSAAWSAIVTAAPAQGRIMSSKPGDRRTRVQLTRDLQAELKRVGCYGGEITGAWSSSTKRAMRAFMERVNATLPIEDPDYILLTLVQGHTAQACGVGCPSGQTPSDSGRCLPNAVVAARAAKDIKTPAAADGVSDGRVARNRLQPPAPRTSIASVAKPPVGAAARAAPVRAAQDQVAARTDTGRAERLPWQDGDTSAPRRVSRPDGMMAIGGPRHEADPTQAPPSATITPPRGRMHIVTTEDDVDWRNDRAAPVLAPPSGEARAEEYFEPESAAKPVRSASKRKHAKSAKRGKSAPYYARKVKPAKFFYYAGNNNGRRRGFPRPGSPAYNMLQAMGGIF